MLIASTRTLHAQGSEVSAQECCLPMLLIVGARSLGLGDAVVARTSPASLFVNPALIANVLDDQFLVHNEKTSLQTSNVFTFLIHSEVAGTFALSYRLIEIFEQEARDEQGNVTGTFNFSTHQLLATYATQVMTGLTAGVSYNLYADRYTCRGACGSANYSATTHGLDVGVQFEPPSNQYLAFGAAIQHLGFPLQVNNAAQANPMPLRARAGAGYEVLHHFRPDSTVSIWATGELIGSPRDGSASFSVGAEADLERTLFLRAGYASSGPTGAAGAGVGVGLRYDRFDIGVAKSFVTNSVDVTEPTQITFAIRF